MKMASAADLAGNKCPDFVTGVAYWLADDDAASLPIFSSLAARGNTAARLLLSRIEATDRAPSDYVQRLSRDDRMTMFRAPGDGIFKPSWLRVEAESGNTTASLLYDALAPGINLSGIGALLLLGEEEATEHQVRKVAVDGSPEQRRELAQLLPDDSELLPYLQSFISHRSGLTPGRAALQHMISSVGYGRSEPVPVGDGIDDTEAMLFVDVGYQAGDQTPGYGKKNAHYDNITRWILQAPEAGPIATLCMRICSNSEVPACANAAFGLIGGYYEVIRFDSPLESIIPQSRYLSSERALGMMLRRLASIRTDAGDEIFNEDELRSKSACLAAALRT